MRLTQSLSLAVLISCNLFPLAAEASKGKVSFNKKSVICTDYDGVTNDLLTAGLGASGLGLGSQAPTLSNPATAEELRALAIYNNYRALVPTDPGGGYATIFGPNIDADGNDTLGEGLVAGTECLAFTKRKRVALMVQIPDTFDPENACIITAPSSGSRGIYGAIGTAGEWGLRKGCAVAYTSKGTGSGVHNLETNTVNLLRGERIDAAEAGRKASFKARISENKRLAFNAETPDRVAYMHAHSQKNPEADWGLNVLQAIEFSFAMLNRDCKKGKYCHRYTSDNTLVIASSISNGGGSSVRAAEIDKKGLIDGIAVSEPNITPKYTSAFGIQQGDGDVFYDHSRSLYDYTTVLGVYQGCASAAARNVGAPFNVGASEERCTSLFEKGLVQGDTTEERAAHAQAIVNAAGLLPEQNITQPSHHGLYVGQAINMTYANAYGRFSVLRNLCGFSFAAVDANGYPTELSEITEQGLFATSNGVPPTAGIQVINNNSVGGPIRDQISISPSTGRADQNLDGALCFRNLATGKDEVTGRRLKGRDYIDSKRIAWGISRIEATADLKGLPAVFVVGRNDAVLAPNHTSRAYVGRNRVVEGELTNLRYYEITNAHHLDALTVLDVALNTPLFSDKFIPLHHYYFQALDIMYDHLTKGAELPPSQVVHTVPRGANGPTLADVPPLVEEIHLPEISSNPDAADLITFSDGILHIPD